MERDFIIYGAGDFAHTVYTIITKRMKRSVAYFCVDDEYYKEGQKIENIPVIGRTQLNKLGDTSRYAMALGFVGHMMSDQREKAYKDLKRLGFSFDNVIDTVVDYPENIGEGNIIMQNVFLGYDSVVGNGNIIWAGTVFPHNNRVGDFNIFGPTSSLSGNSCVGNHCFIGNNASVKNHICIADYTLVGAGAYVQCDTERESVIVPQRAVRLEGKSCWDFEVK